jgi:hypothetical protein
MKKARKVRNFKVAQAEMIMRKALKDIPCEDIVNSAVRSARLHVTSQIARDAKKEKRRRRNLPLFD